MKPERSKETAMHYPRVTHTNRQNPHKIYKGVGCDTRLTGAHRERSLPCSGAESTGEAPMSAVAYN